MRNTYLDFEQPLGELEGKIEQLRYVQADSAVDISEEISRLQQKSQTLTKDIYSKLTPWQTSMVARHPQRPYTLDYVREIFTDFHELHGDRMYADDLSIVGGMARFNGTPCMVLGHQKGRDTKERAARNFGMPRPEGYRKAMRLMRLAEKFNLPVFTFVDTPGAYPGIGAEERGQSEAIGHNLYAMAELKVPIISTIIGEGGSGGALAIAVGNVLESAFAGLIFFLLLRFFCVFLGGVVAFATTTDSTAGDGDAVMLCRTPKRSLKRLTSCTLRLRTCSR